MNRFLTWILILSTLHVPVYLPDTDGECRGTPIESLIESQAWHPVLLGVRPNDDIDRGPIRTDDEQESSFDGSQFGDVAILGSVSANDVGSTAMAPVAIWNDGFQGDLFWAETVIPSVPLPRAGRTVCICYCIWRI